MSSSLVGVVGRVFVVSGGVILRWYEFGGRPSEGSAKLGKYLPVVLVNSYRNLVSSHASPRVLSPHTATSNHCAW